jgi:hypothetical protein
MGKINRFTIYILIIFSIFTIGLALAGYFQIGLLSDDYFNINGSIHSSLADKLTGNLPFTNSYHLRTTFYMSMESSNYLHNLLGYSYDDFLLYRIQNLLLYLILAYIAGRIILLITEHLSVALLTSLTIIVFPNNINNICWVAARVELLCGIFFLIALFYAFKYVKEGNQTAFVSCLISFIAALLTKEISITIPLITAILIFAFYGKDMLLKNKMIIIVQFALLLVYVFYKIIILGNNVGEMLTLYQASPLSNAPGILARAAIALSMPMDYLTLNISLRNKDPLLMLYLASLYGALFYLISVMVRNEIYKYMGYMALAAIILLVPNIYIGYIRTQMILVPFIILTILLYWTYDHQIKNSIHINKMLLKGFFAVALCFWCYWSYTNVSDWAYSYAKGKQEMVELINTHIDEGKRTIIIGNPGRYRQAFLFDKLTGAYNYWKNKDFVIKDTINDIVQTGALDEASLSAKLNYKELQPGEFEISTTGISQYFYIEGYDNEKIKEGFKNREMSVEFMEFNILNKPTKLNLKMLTSQIKCFLCGEFKFTRIY